VKQDGESAKVAVRNIRRDAITHLKALLKDSEVSEDEEKRAQEDVQKMTDKSIADIDRLVAEKEKELMAV
jgi:ribosome recycling factor